MEKQIRVNKLSEQMPNYLGMLMSSTIAENMSLSTPEHDHPRSFMQEDQLSAVPKLGKDTLMPKDLS